MAEGHGDSAPQGALKVALSGTLDWVSVLVGRGLAQLMQESILLLFRGDGNCWYRAICDQIVLHDLAYLPRNHLALRAAVIDYIRQSPMLRDWEENAVGAEKVRVDKQGKLMLNETEKEKKARKKRIQKKMEDFLREHAKASKWTDDSGVMCQVRKRICG